MGLYKRRKLWWMSFTMDGRQKRVSTGQTNRRTAEEVWARVKTSLIVGTYVPDEQRSSVLACPPFEVAVESYLEYREDQGKNPRSYERLSGKWKEVFAGRRLGSITSEEIAAKLREWANAHGWSNATRNTALWSFPDIAPPELSVKCTYLESCWTDVSQL